MLGLLSENSDRAPHLVNAAASRVVLCDPVCLFRTGWCFWAIGPEAPAVQVLHLQKIQWLTRFVTKNKSLVLYQQTWKTLPVPFIS